MAALRTVWAMVVARDHAGGPRPLDRLAFGAVVVLLGALAVSGDGGPGDRGIDFGAIWLLALATGLAVLGRRLPATAALANWAITVVWHQAGYGSAVVTVPYLVAFYLLGASGDRVRELLVGGLAVVGSSVAILATSDESTGAAASAVGWTLAALLLGELAHHRRMLLEEYAERARRAEADAEREAEERIARNQLEIARDLHDVLAHTVAVMTVQAAAGREALDRGERDETAGALDAIRHAGREATGEVRALISILRDGSTPPATAPAPGLDRIPALAEAARAAGVEVDVTVEAVGASEVAGLTAYRVVQESLTNVVRHSCARRARVAVRRRGPDLVVAVDDDGTGPAGAVPEAGADARPAREGLGLRGMRERVEALGGTVRAGRQAGGGWRVEALVPGDGAGPR